MPVDLSLPNCPIVVGFNVNIDPAAMFSVIFSGISDITGSNLVKAVKEQLGELAHHVYDSPGLGRGSQSSRPRDVFRLPSLVITEPKGDWTVMVQVPLSEPLVVFQGFEYVDIPFLSSVLSPLTRFLIIAWISWIKPYAQTSPYSVPTM